MNAFITGSRAYGSPRPNSDIDLVIRVDSRTRLMLETLSDNPKTDKYGSVIVRFGRLNLLLCETDEEFATWVVGTNKMLVDKRKGISTNRDDAKNLFDMLRDMIGIQETGGSGGE